MSTLLYIVLLLISGLFVGALGRLAVPGRDPMGLGATILVGIAGSFLAGLVYAAVTHEHRGGGLLLSVLFSALIVYVIRRFRGEPSTRLGRRPG
jgi:uncharacterized membrane protein YeaQ/YmgE (transglycosylase-associated protein family)